MDIANLVTLVSFAVSTYAAVAIAFVAWMGKRRRRSRARAEELRLLDVIRDTMPPSEWVKVWDRWNSSSSSTARRALLVDALSDSPLKPLDSEKPPERFNVLESHSLTALEERLATVEARLPDDETVSMIASANEARIAVIVEHLERDLSRLSDRTLTRGDVVTVVFAVLGTIGALLAVTTWVLGELTAAQ